MSMTLWVTLHSLIWNGKISRDEDLPFPFNVLARLLKGDKLATINLNEATFKEDNNNEIVSISNSKYYDGYLSTENRISDSSLSEISLNNL